jgi:TPR repeat protein
VEYYRKAAYKGHAAAQYNLGLAYWQGAGAPRDRRKAYVWIGLAASQGLKQALKVIKLMEYRLPAFVIKDGKHVILQYYERYVLPYRDQGS